MLLKKIRELRRYLWQRKLYEKRIRGLNIKGIEPIRKGQKKRFVLFGTPEYNNLGDHAIAWAMFNFLQQNFPDVEVLEIPESRILKNFVTTAKEITDRDVICLIGGGNLGNQYIDQRLIRNAAIQAFPNNKIVVFPQSVYYTNNSNGKKALREDRAVFENHPDLYLFSRDVISYKLMQEYYQNCNVYCVPDIVLSMQGQVRSYMREGQILCLRNDVEGTLSAQDKEIIKTFYPNAKLKDTCLKENISPALRVNEIMSFLDEISKAELVITDRLHGVIFCAITNTPCIVFNNYNHKIKGILEWLKDCSHIAYARNLEQVKIVVHQLSCNHMMRSLEEKFRCLTDILSE